LVGVTTDSATIMWNTNEPTISHVVYSTFPQVGPFESVEDLHEAYDVATVDDPAPVIASGAFLAGLQSGTTYYYRVVSVDPSGNFSYSEEEKSFTTLGGG